MDPVQLLSIEMEKFQLRLNDHDTENDEPIYETLPEKRHPHRKKSTTTSFRHSLSKHLFNSEPKERKPPLPKRNKTLHRKGGTSPFFHHHSLNNIYTTTTSNDQDDLDKDYCRIKKNCALCEPIYIDIELLEEIRSNLNIDTSNNTNNDNNTNDTNDNIENNSNAAYSRIDPSSTTTCTCTHHHDDQYNRRPASFSHGQRPLQCPYTSHLRPQRCGSAPSKSSKKEYIILQREKLPTLQGYETEIIYEDIVDKRDEKDLEEEEEETYVYMGPAMGSLGAPMERFDENLSCSDGDFSFRSLSPSDTHSLDYSMTSSLEDSDEYYIYDEITPLYGNVSCSLDDSAVASSLKSDNMASCIYGNMASSPIDVNSPLQPVYDNVVSSSTASTSAFSEDNNNNNNIFIREFSKELVYAELELGQNSLTGSLRDKSFEPSCLGDQDKDIYAKVDIQKSRGLSKAIEKSRNLATKTTSSCLDDVQDDVDVDVDVISEHVENDYVIKEYFV